MIKKLITIVLLLAFGFAGWVWWNRTLLERALTYPEAPVTAADWYTPMLPIDGTEGAELPTAQARTIAPVALEQAAAFAKARQSVGLLVLHQGQVVAEHYWGGHTAASTTNSMSMMKTVVALLVGIAIEEGHIGAVTDTVAQYIPEWAEDDRRHITLEHLLYMTSGLRNDDRESWLWSDLVQMYMGIDVNELVLAIPAEKMPGTVYEYNNANTQLLGIVIARATGRPFQAYLAEKLWTPLGAGEAAIWLDEERGVPKTFCCFFATARDWGRIGLLMAHKGRYGVTQVVPEAWIARMTRPSPLEPDYGLHIWLDRGGRNAHLRTTPILDGRASILMGARHQRVYVLPTYDLVIVRVGDTPQAWDDAFLPNTLIRGIAPVSSE